ncbi:Multidrug resistance protein MdtN [Planctomycetes bacterium CA13]|uniref:Multidrug resistance protein MdtN n=1 Tax=Novipirellula herctigrandis TaxID=2527986 RepID=A0A5C5ZBE6_9BACT|nr:Multidrug resistance protein MdtN [Planctomycetes bacterium CA13]
MNTRHSLTLIILCVIAALGYYAWHYIEPEDMPEGIASSNGRIEAVEIDIATKTPGRLVDVLVDEGDFLTAGQEIAHMDTRVLDAQLGEAKANLLRAKNSVDVANSIVKQQQCQETAAEALVSQRKAELSLATKNFKRAEELSQENAVSVEDFDTKMAALFSAKAGVSSAEANVATAKAGITAAKSQVIEAEASVAAAESTIQRIQADIDDSTLVSPRDGRVQYRVAQPGEVLGAGGTVLNMVDLSDVYMTFFLPTEQAGRVTLGADVRLVLDAVPQFVIPAQATFVADVAQFTPKTVETEVERQKLMFRIKARIDPDLLNDHIRKVKTGLPGMAYVRLGEQYPWPDDLKVKLPK